MIIREFDDIAALAASHEADWRRIAGASSSATVFQTWEWTAAWWRHQGRGKRLLALAFHNEGEVVGLAALYLPSSLAPLRTLRFVGNGGSDYLDMIALPGHECAVAEAFTAYLTTQGRRWDWADLQQIRPGAVAAAMTNMPGVTSWKGETCPYLPLAADWEAFRKTLGKKLRQNIGYYARALEKQYQVEWRTATTDTLATDMRAFYDLHQKRWNKRWMPGAFRSEQARAFHEEAARNLLASDMLRLHTLTLDGRIQAALYCFQKSRRCYYYLGGFEPELARHSIGTILTAYAIRYAIEKDGATEFDFLRGDEPYKYKWGAQDRFNQRLSLTRPGLVRPTLLQATGKASLNLERRLKHWMHQQHAGKTTAKKSQPGKESNNGDE